MISFQKLLSWSLPLLSIMSFSELSYANQHSIPQSSLGKFTTNYSQITQVDKLNSNQVIGNVVVKPGANYKVSLPIDIQQLTYYKQNGTLVKQSDVIAKLSGFDVHHFIDEMETAKSIFNDSKKYFEATRSAADSRTFKTAEWLEISKKYAQAKLNYEHFIHLREILKINSDDSVDLLSPVEGILQVPNQEHMQGNSSHQLFEVIPADSLLLKAYVPAQKLALLSNLFNEDNGCSYQIQQIEPVIKNYHQTVWAQPSSNQCSLTLGQKVVLTPQFSQTANKIIKSAVFELDNKDYIAIKNGENLTLINVNIIDKQGDYFIFTAQQELVSSFALSSSVSIAQGLFMGLGD